MAIDPIAIVHTMESVLSTAPMTAIPSCNNNNNNHFALMQMNGRKVLGPPEGWTGEVPSSACELYVRRIPKDLNEQLLIQPFLRFGRIYEIRLPMDFNQANRGYAYVKYTTEEEAACAMEVLSHYYVAPRRKLEILHSYEKCRLFVNNIPKHLDEAEIEEKMRSIFPSMQRIYTRGAFSLRDLQMGSNNVGEGDNCLDPSAPNFVGAKNRGHVFIHFPTHMHALEAKKSTTPGVIRMWDRDLKVVWANTEREADMCKSTKTLFVRNVDLSVNNRDIIDLLVKCVPRTTIRKISKVRTTAFFDFTTREAAEKCLQELQGTVLRGHRLDLEWAKPSEQQSLHRMRKTDFDAMLRLKCIANGWQIPVIIFGTYFELEGLQYGAVLLRDSKGKARAIFCIMQPHELVDIHSRMCEVVCVLIETIGTFPDYNYVFMVQKDNAHLLGLVTHNMQSVDFIAAHNVPTEFYFDLNEIIDLSWAAATLVAASEETLLNAYHESFRTHSVCTYLQNWPVLGGYRIFGTIMPKYRNKPQLKYNLNDTQIVLALCFASTGTNSSLPSRPYMAFAVSNFCNGNDSLRYLPLKLLPIALTQSRFAVTHVLSHVLFGGSQYYHPSQQIMFPPLWISGCPYSVSIKQSQTVMQQHHQQPYLPQSCSSSNSNHSPPANATTTVFTSQPPQLTLGPVHINTTPMHAHAHFLHTQ